MAEVVDTEDVVTDETVVLVVVMHELHKTGQAWLIAPITQSPAVAEEHGLDGSTIPLQTPVVVLLLLVVVDELVTVDAVIVDEVTVDLVVIDELVETVLLVNVETVLDVMVVALTVVDVVVTQLLHNTGQFV